MKTLADVKREMVVGSEWEAFSYFGNCTIGTVAVHRKQSNAVTFLRNGKESWFYFPKAKDISFQDDDTFIVKLDDGVPCLRYRRL